MDSRNSNPFTAKQDVLDAHLSDELLLLFADGELASCDAAQVRLHLEACWTCRARVAQINESIQQVVAYSNYLVQEKFPPSALERNHFLAKLRGLAEKDTPRSILERISISFRPILSNWRRPIWISGLGLACTIAILLVMFRLPRKVSADEIIHKSRESEKALLKVVPRPVIYQELHIEMAGRTKHPAVDRAIYSDPVSSRVVEARNHPTSSLPAAATVESVQEALLDADLDWQDPLSVRSFVRWQAVHRERADRVDTTDPGKISIRSTLPHGPVAELTLTFRSSDFHPVAENISFRNLDEVRITEEFFEVFSLNVLDAGIFDLKSPPAPEVAAKHATMKPVAPRVPSEKELLMTEMRALVALHSVKADLGDQIELQRPVGSNFLVVQGVAPSEERKAQIESELQGIPGVQMNLTVPAQGNDPLSSAEEQPVAQVSVLVDDQPLLEACLKTKFPDAEARASFVNTTLEHAQQALAHAWAIKRLEQRYPPQVISNLDPPSRQMLELLLRDHVHALRNLAETEVGLLRKISPQVPHVSEQGSLRPAKDWRTASKATFSALETLQHDALILLAGSQGIQDLDGELREMNAAIHVLNVEMPVMGELVNGNFLEANETSIIGLIREQP
jgi:hypothetical protein